MEIFKFYCSVEPAFGNVKFVCLINPECCYLKNNFGGIQFLLDSFSDHSFEINSIKSLTCEQPSFASSWHINILIAIFSLLLALFLSPEVENVTHQIVAIFVGSWALLI